MHQLDYIGRVRDNRHRLAAASDEFQVAPKPGHLPYNLLISRTNSHGYGYSCGCTSGGGCFEESRSKNNGSLLHRLFRKKK